MSNAVHLNITDTIFKDNSVPLKGRDGKGGVLSLYALNSNNKFESFIKGCVFQNNSANFGGSYYIYARGRENVFSTHIVGTIFQRNAGAWGGAGFYDLFEQNHVISTSIHRSQFTDNTALHSGGAFATIARGKENMFVLDVQDTNYVGNSALHGGVHRLLSTGVGNFFRKAITRSTFQSNFAKKYGGVDNMLLTSVGEDNTFNSTSTHSYYSNNSAHYAGIHYMKSLGQKSSFDLNIKAGTLVNNTATVAGLFFFHFTPQGHSTIMTYYLILIVLIGR